MSSVNSIIRIFRLLTIPFLGCTIIVLLPRQSPQKLKKVFPLCFPAIMLLFVNLLQLLALPDYVIQTHATGSMKFTAWFLLYFSIVLALHEKTVDKVRRIISITLAITFIVGILQYPNIVMQAGANVGSALSNYGQLGERYQLAGIFGSANEDANGLVTLFPLTLLWIEQQKGAKRKILRYLLLIYFPLVLVFNGTRTALLVSFPLLTTLFYWKLPLKKLLYIIGPLAGFGVSMIAISENILNRFFEQESQGGGSFGWRIEYAWSPSINHTLSNSPLFGFGSRGWEYVGNQLSIFDLNGGGVMPAHSGYVWSFVSWGLLGFLMYVSLLLILLINSFQLSRSKRQDISESGRALFCSVIGYCLWAFISNVMWPQGWLILISLSILIVSLKVSAYENIQLSE